MKCRDKRLDDPTYYNKHNFELIFEQNAQFAENNKTEEKEMPTNAVIQGVSDLSNLFEDEGLVPVIDGFMLQDIDFEGMSWPEVERTIARLRREAETRASRVMANQTEQERKAEKQAYKQYLAMLDDFEDWLYERKFGHQDNYYEDDDYGYDNDEDEWER